MAASRFGGWAATGPGSLTPEHAGLFHDIEENRLGIKSAHPAPPQKNEAAGRRPRSVRQVASRL